MGISIETIKASQLAELTEVTDSNYVIVTDGDTSKKIKATNLKGDLSNINSAVNLNSEKTDINTILATIGTGTILGATSGGIISIYTTRKI